jgi:hypothetical protein
MLSPSIFGLKGNPMQEELEAMRQKKLQHLEMEMHALDQAVHMMDGGSGLTLPVQERLRRCEKLIAGLLAARRVELANIMLTYKATHPTPIKPEVNPEAEFRA